MSELLRYEEAVKQQLSELSLPDENFAWAEMKKLLDEEDDDRVIVLPWKWGCGPVGILLAVLFTGLCWFLIRPEKWFIDRKPQTKETVQNNTSGIQQNKPANPPPVPIASGDSTQGSGIKKDHQTDTLQVRDNDQTGKKRTRPIINLVNAAGGADSIIKSAVGRERKAYKYKVPVGNEEKREPEKNKNSKGKRAVVPKGNISAIKQPGRIERSSAKEDDTIHAMKAVPSAKDSLFTASVTGADSTINSVLIKEPLIADKADSLMKKDSTMAKKEKQSTYSWGAGLAINQQIPFDGQKAVPYNSLGRKGSLADYIPSAYIRFYKDRKWFIQAELRYGAPQYTKNIVYGIQKNLANNTDTNLVVKKTYYNQLPLGFNYYVLPGLTIGSGFVWNKFSNAISEQKIQTTPAPGQGDTVVSTSIFRTRRNNNQVFSKSFLQLMMEVQYSHNRYTTGARYARGLQPFIRFQLPGEPVKEERNSSLQLFFRYELWKSKKK